MKQSTIKLGLTVEVRVGVGDNVGARAEVDQLDLVSLVEEIDQDIFVLDVPVDDTPLVACEDCLNDLAQERSGKVLLQWSLYERIGNSCWYEIKCIVKDTKRKLS